MKQVVLNMEESLYHFYELVGVSAGRVMPEQVMADALFRLAGELSLEALDKNQDK